MKHLLLLALFLPLAGCVTEARYPNGIIALRTWSDSTQLKFDGGGISLSAATIKNSAPTRAALLGANKIVGTVASAAVAAMVPGSGATAVISKTAISAVPHITAPAAVKPGDQ